MDVYENKEISPKVRASIVIKNLRLAFEKNNKYTSREIVGIAINILAQLPDDYSVEDINNYEKDYLIALNQVKKEFSEKKNL